MSNLRVPRIGLGLVLSAVLAALIVVPPRPTVASAGPALLPPGAGLLNYGPNAAVTAVTHDPTAQRTYVAGDFTRWGPQTGGMAVTNNTDGTLHTGFPAVIGTVRTAVSDGAGGVYIGGTFQYVGGVARTNAAHILANGTVDPNWIPEVTGMEPDDGVYDLVRIGSDIVLGGRFWGPSGGPLAVTRVDTTGSVVASFTPASLDGDGRVNKLVVNGDTSDTIDTIYAVGSFGSMLGESRNRGVELDAATGALGDWDPGANGTQLTSVEMVDGNLVIGGDFTTLTDGADWVAYLATYRPDGTLRTTWAPEPNGPITAMEIAEGSLYVSGDFDDIAGRSRAKAASLLTDFEAGPVLGPWNPALDAPAVSLQHSNLKIYAAGTFETVGGTPVHGIARADATGTGTLDAGWAPPEPAYPSDLAGPQRMLVAAPMGQGLVVMGGRFSVVGGLTVNRLAALADDGSLLTTFDVGTGPDARIHDMVVDDGTLYVAGAFNEFAGEQRSAVAAVDATDGTLASWGGNIQPDNVVHALAVADGNLLLGGSFSEVMTTGRAGLAAIRISDETLLSWGSGALVGGASVTALEARMSEGELQVYAGGSFTPAGGSTTNLTKLVGADGVVDTGYPGADGSVHDLALTADRLYVGGDFTSVGPGAAPNVAAINLADDELAAWLGSTDALVQSIAADDEQVIVGGPFGSAFGAQARGLAAAGTDAFATSMNWNAEQSELDAAVHSLTLVADPDSGVADRALIGGEETYWDGVHAKLFYADINTAAVADPPRNVRAIRGGSSGEVDLSWDAPASMGVGVTDPVGYRVQRAAPPYTSWSEIVADTQSTGTSLTVTGQPDNQRYRYRVAALTEVGGAQPAVGGFSTPSTWARAASPADLPGVPQNVVASPDVDSMIRVQADAPTSWGANASGQGYRAVASIQGIPMGYCNDFDEFVSTLDSCYIAGLTPGADYDVTARALNSRNLWGPWVTATGSPVQAQFLAPQGGTVDGRPNGPTAVAPQTQALPAPAPGNPQTTNRQLRASRFTAVRLRTVKVRGTKRHRVVATVRVTPGNGRTVHLQRKVCRSRADQRMCVWRTVATAKAHGVRGAATVRSTRPLRTREPWRVYLPGTRTALPAVTATLRR